MSRKKRKPARAKSPVITTTVQNPDWRPDLEGVMGIPRTVSAALNTKESAVETLYHRGFLAISQKRAADHFRELWEAAGGKVGSIDYTRDRVDGGRGEPITGRLQAAQELERVRSLVGRRNYETLEKLCGEGRAISEIAPHKRAKLTMADNLRGDLDDCATMWGYQTRQRTGRAA
ncbi:MAG TPA: hypothetical protein VMF90_12305 [Rhizobiaceae bacterium]|nr:hypothetical protein [Rhizobiaceae bacterium]